MDSLTKKGLRFINANKELLSAFAKEKFEKEVDTPKGDKEYGTDAWFYFDTGTEGKPEESIDINIWLDDSECQDVGTWRATAYPMEYNINNEIQTNGCEFVRLW